MKQYHKKRIWKRGVACMLAIALAFSGITWNGLAVSNAANAGIPNANFNTVFLSYVSNWTQDGAVENARTSKVTANQDSRRDYSGKLIKNGAGIALISSADMTDLVAGTLYKLEVSVKTEGAKEQNLQLMVRHLKADGSFITESIATLYQNEADNAWKEMSGYFRFKGGEYKEYKNARLVVAMTDKKDGVFSKNATINATMYVDDASIQTVSEPSVDTVDVSYEGNLSSMQVEYDTSGYATDKPVVERATKYYNVGQSSLHVKKDSYNSQTYLRNLGRFALQNEQPMDGSIYTWGAYVKSVDSNSFLRVDLDVYDIDGRYLSTLTGNATMLSRSETLGDWRKMSTSAELPTGAYYASYKIAVTEGKAEFYLDNLFGTVTENYYYKLSDWSYFTGVDEVGNINGWTTDAEVSVSDNTASWSTGKMTRRVETLIPGAAYQLTADYTATADGQCSIIFYDVDQKELGRLDKTCAGVTERAQLTADFVMPEKAMYAEVSFGGTGSYTLTKWQIEETLGRAVDSEWTANWVWYPEKLNTENVDRYFRSHFQIEDKTQISAVYLQIAYDDEMEIHVNGNREFLSAQYVDGQGGPSPYHVAGKRKVEVYAITDQVKDGNNLLAVKVSNGTSYGGVVYELLVCYTDGRRQTLASGVSLSVRSSTDATNWYATDTDESVWVEARKAGVPAYSVLGDVTWWAGPIEYNSDRTDRLTFNTGDASNGFLNMNETKEVTAGADVTFSGKVDNVSTEEREAFHDSTITGWLYKHTDGKGTMLATVPVHVKLPDVTHASFTYTVPDYLPAGTYDLRLDNSKVVWCWNSNNQFGLLKVTAATKDKKKVSVSKKDNGTAGLYIEREEISPIMYLRPHMEGLYKYHSMSNFAESDVAIYSTYNGFLDGMDYTYQKDSADSTSKCIWTGWENNAPVIDTELFDYEIYRTLNLNPKANVMVQIGVDAPKWWMDSNPKELVKDQNGEVITTGTFKQKSVSMSSTKYQEQVAEVLKALVSHMESASYAHRVVGIRLVAGRTFEWMHNGVESGKLVDYSEAAVTDFRSYLKELYGTDDKLQAAWGDSSTIATATIPTAAERNTTDSVALLNPSAQRKVIDYNNYLGEASANYLLSCADAIKATMTAQWIVGAYNGYLWNFSSSEAIGSAHTSVSKVLASDSIDFIASPANYGERISGYATGNMALSDSIAAAGKLYMIEQDNRTYLSGQSGDSLGATYTVSDSVDQITRDMSMDFIRGAGLWFYDMEGGWFDDNSIEARIKALKAEWDKHLDNGSNNEVAVYVAEGNYNYLTADISSGNTERTTYLMSSLYEDQRRELSAMGASYDTYMVEDVLESADNAKWSKYKFHIVLSPFELTTDEAAKLKSRLGQSNSVILWVYLPGASTGRDYNGANIKDLVGMDVTLTKEKKALQAKTIDDVAGVTYGNKNAKTGPWAYITDAEATVLAKYTSGEKAAAAYKNNGTYISAYSAVPDVPAEMLRYLCEKAGVHLYSADKSDVIETNNSYIAIHSVNGGEKTINLSQMQSEKYVYDVLQGKYLSVKNQKVTFQMESGQTRLLRVESEPTDMELAGTMEYQDVTENPTAYLDNLFYNGDFDGDAGSADTAGWVAGTGAIETQIVSNDVEETVITKYSNDFTGKNSTHGWNISYTTTDVESKGDNEVLSFTKGTNPYITYYGTPFEAGKSYIVSCRVYCDEDTSFRLYNDSTGSAVSEHKTAKGGEWTEYSISMTATNAVQTPETYFSIMDGHSQVYIDDVSIEEVTRVVHTVPKYQILYSNDFTGKNSTHGWNISNTTTNVESKGDNEVLSFTKGTNPYITYYGTPFEAGKSYIVSCKVYCDTDTSFRLYNDSTGSAVSEHKTAKGGEWTEYSISMTATNAVQQPETYFSIMDGHSQVYIDDVSVKRYEGEVNRKIYSEGVGNCNQEESDNVLMISQATEFWNYGVTVQEGKTYTYSMDVKVTDAGEGFKFMPYVHNFAEGGWQDITDMSVTADTNGWKKVTATFTAMKPNANDGTRFGFSRNGTGKVYLDNITLVEAEKEDEVPVDNMVLNGDTLESWASMTPVPCFTGKGATGSEASQALQVATTKYKTYIVKFRADVTGTNQIQVKLGTRTVDSVDLSEVSGWKEFTCEIGIKESTTDFAITTADGQTITWDNIRVYRKYDMGDANGDGVVDSRDLVRLKWNTSEKDSPNPLATYVFVDFTNHTGAFVDGNDMKAMRTWFCK